jgi:citrate lyase beta subunit
MQCKQGKAVIQFKGKMIDAAVVTRAKNLLSRVAVKSSRS